MHRFDEEELKRHVTDKDTWLRFVYSAVCGAAFYLSAILTFAIAILQFLAKLLSGSAFVKLVEFGGNLALYQSQLTRYLAFTSEERPFPFGPFPGTVTHEPPAPSLDLPV